MPRHDGALDSCRTSGGHKILTVIAALDFMRRLIGTPGHSLTSSPRSLEQSGE